MTLKEARVLIIEEAKEAMRLSRSSVLHDAGRRHNLGRAAGLAQALAILYQVSELDAALSEVE